MSKHASRWSAGFMVIVLLVWGCSGEPFGGPLFGTGGAAGALSGGQAGSGGLAGSGGSAGQPAGGQAGQDAGASDALVEAEADAPGEAQPDAQTDAQLDAPSTGCEQCKCALQANQWCGTKPPQPSSELTCSTLRPSCCYCPASCYARAGCTPSVNNPIGGSTWWCCEAGA